MMFERFTTAARSVVLRSREEAQALHHGHIGTEHLLLAMLDEGAGGAYRVLHDAGVERELVRADIERLLGKPSKLLGDEDAAALKTIGIDLDAVLGKIEESFGAHALEELRPSERRGLLRRGLIWVEDTARQGRGDGTGFTVRAKKVIELSLREAIRLGHNYIGTEHLLLGMIRDGGGLATKVLTEQGVSLDDLRQAAITALRRAA